MLPTAAHPTLTLGVGLSKGAARPGRERGTVSMGGGGVTWAGGAASPAEGGVAGSAIREWLLRVWACFQLIIFLFLSISLTSIFLVSFQSRFSLFFSLWIWSFFPVLSACLLSIKINLAFHLYAFSEFLKSLLRIFRYPKILFPPVERSFPELHSWRVIISRGDSR